jgi:hypothetical protein
MPRWIAAQPGLILLAAVVLSLPACIRRTETIQVEPDGTIRLAVEFDGDASDVRGGDAMLTDAGPWAVTDVERVEDDKPKLMRTATLTVAPGEPVPGDYAGGDAELAALALQMSTTLEVEERPEGTYYHFRRVYLQRDWARIDHYRRELVENQLNQLDEKKFEEMSPDNQRTVARAFIDFEMVKSLVLAEAAAEQMIPPMPQMPRLAIHSSIRDVYQAVDVDVVVQILTMEHEDSAGAIQAEVERVAAAQEQAAIDALTNYDPTGAMATAYLHQLDLERERFAISEDLQDESFEVKLRLPGNIVGHNSFQSVSDDGEITWEFDGRALNDRDEALLATSVVERK